MKNKQTYIPTFSFHMSQGVALNDKSFCAAKNQPVLSVCLTLCKFCHKVNPVF